MYRFWIFSETFTGNNMTVADNPEKARRERKEFLDVLSTEELRQLQMITQFLVETYDSVRQPSGSFVCQMIFN